MSPRVEERLGRLLGEARTRLGASLQDVAEKSGCSAAYVHKLEQDRVRTPSPRVLARLAQTLGLDYAVVMRAVGYEAEPGGGVPAPPTAVARFSNAHIVQLLEGIAAEVAGLRRDLARQRSSG
jgi:transcriptional regulator with XRE-family HTH domain